MGMVTVPLPLCVGVMDVPGGGGERVVMTLLLLLLLLGVGVGVADELSEVWDPVEEVPGGGALLEVELLPPVLVVFEVGGAVELPVELPVLVGWPVWVADGVHWSAERVNGFSA